MADSPRGRIQPKTGRTWQIKDNTTGKVYTVTNPPSSVEKDQSWEFKVNQDSTASLVSGSGGSGRSSA